MESENCTRELVIEIPADVVQREAENVVAQYARVARIPGLQKLLHYVCKNGYEHHVAVNLSHYGASVAEALSNYKGWEVHRHEA